MEEEEFFNKVYVNAGELDLEIQKLELFEPDKRTKEFKSWKDKINHLYKLYNAMVKFKCYKLI